MADEYIRREDAKDALQEKVFHNLTDEFYGAMQAIDELPSADVAPVIHAHWRWMPNHDVICSKCQYVLPSGSPVSDFRFCPYCGAKMDEVINDA